MAITLRAFIVIALSLVLSTITAPTVSPRTRLREEGLKPFAETSVGDLAVHNSDIHRRDFSTDGLLSATSKPNKNFEASDRLKLGALAVAHSDRTVDETDLAIHDSDLAIADSDIHTRDFSDGDHRSNDANETSETLKLGALALAHSDRAVHQSDLATHDREFEGWISHGGATGGAVAFCTNSDSDLAVVQSDVAAVAHSDRAVHESDLAVHESDSAVHQSDLAVHQSDIFLRDSTRSDSKEEKLNLGALAVAQSDLATTVVTSPLCTVTPLCTTTEPLALIHDDSLVHSDRALIHSDSLGHSDRAFVHSEIAIHDSDLAVDQSDLAVDQSDIRRLLQINTPTVRSHNRGHRRVRAEELSTVDVEDSEPTTGLTTGDLTNSPFPSVDPQQSPRLLPSEQPEDPHATAHGSQTAPSREQSPSRVGMRPRIATQGLSPSRLAGVSGTAHRGSHTPPRGITRRSESCSESGQVSPTGGDMDEDFIIKSSEVIVLRQEYSEFITLKDNTEIVLAEAMEATERLNTVFSRVRASMSRMSPRMKELFAVPSNQASGKTLEPSNNRAHDKAAAQAATQHIIDQTSMVNPAPASGAEERARTTRSCVPGDRCSQAPLSRNIPEDIPHTARGEQGEDSQPRRGREAHTVYARDTPEARASVPTHDRPSLSANQVIQGIPESIERSRRSITEPQSIDMNALREEIKATISATIKDKLRSDADSVTTVSQSMQALDANAQYWSDLSTKAVRRSRRALELQLKLAEEKVNNLLHEEAPEEALLEAAREARSIRFQLDQSSIA
ncbi:hypothetical protein M422DRAFT_241183 [Sphaerobolus stellatus SS14]|nr:hypothetical protein M422DRAFT_241183 [Sphaerobolus stellatus SS14]